MFRPCQNRVQFCSAHIDVEIGGFQLSVGIHILHCFHDRFTTRERFRCKKFNRQKISSHPAHSSKNSTPTDRPPQHRRNNSQHALGLSSIVEKKDKNQICVFPAEASSRRVGEAGPAGNIQLTFRAADERSTLVRA